jgi:glycosyltransferase involved in cell wall biosynthesis
MAEPVFAPCVVIPVYNHEHAIGAVVGEIRAQGLAVVLVDDGSSQACADVLQGLSATPDVTLVRHEHNRGKGAAVVTGLHTAHARGYTHAVQIDADGQHTVSDVPRFLEEARQHPDQVICGQPMFDASIPRSRYYGRYLTHGLVWLETLSFELVDTMCGFRVYPLVATLALLDRSGVGERMDFDTEVLARNGGALSARRRLALPDVPRQCAHDQPAHQPAARHARAPAVAVVAHVVAQGACVSTACSRRRSRRTSHFMTWTWPASSGTVTT